MASGRVTNKICIVTGGGTGIGRGCALRLAQEGAKAVVAGRTIETLQETVRMIREAGGEANAVRADVSQVEDCRRLVATTIELYGRVDVLLNNAGYFPRADLLETSDDLWRTIMGVNLDGAFFLCREVVPHMKRQGGGSIINMGTIHGLAGAPRLFAYSVSKGALLTLTRNLAKALVNYKIRVNYVIPGWVVTEGELVIQARDGHDQAWLQEVAKTLPMGRHQTPDDSAWAVLFLASDESEMVTGCVLNTDGGTCVMHTGGGASTD